MSFDESLPVFKAIWDDLSVSEQLRLLEFCKSPKTEPYREAVIKRRSYKNSGPGKDDKPQVLNAVAGR